MFSFPFQRLTMKNVLQIVCVLSIVVIWCGDSFARQLPQVEQAPQAVQTKTVPVFEDGQAQRVRGFSKRQDWIRHDLFVETDFDSDGDGKKDRMHVGVCRQKQTQTEGLKVPVIYETSPYYCGISGANKEFFWNPNQEVGDVPPNRTSPPGIKFQRKRPVITNSQTRQWVPRGYAVVHSCSPGTGLSQGCPTVGGQNESLAPKAVIEWLCGRRKGYTELNSNIEVKADWCNGKVGMTGTSYNGTLPIAAATTGVEGLEAIIPVAPNTSYYHYYRSHGLVRHPGGYMGEDIDVLFDFIHSGAVEMRDTCNCKVRDEDMQKNFDRQNGDYNEWWAGRDYLNVASGIKCAVLMSHGWNDWNVMPEHSVRIYEACKKNKVPCQFFCHQGGHSGGPPPIKMMNRWFTRYLHGVENDVENDAKSWIVREGKTNSEPTAYPEYPHPDASMVNLFPGKGGQGVGPLSFNKTEGQGTEFLTDDVSIKGANLAKAESSENRLLFATPTLTRPVHISGTAKLNIRLAANKPAANLSVWVVSLPWTRTSKIYDNVITRGWADPQNSESLTSSKPLEPGKFYDLSFTLQPDDQVIQVGAKIGLMIFSSDRDFTLWPPAGTQLTVDLDNTSFELPVVGGKEAFEKAVK